jgi:hypothetical protein
MDITFRYSYNFRLLDCSVGTVTLTMWHPLSSKVGTDFANK